MTYAGARGNTAKEMARTLHFSLDQQRLHPAFGQLIGNIQGIGKKRNCELSTANSLWGDKANLSLNANFLRITQTDHLAGFQLVDFVNDPEGARGTINGWVEEKTNKKIENLIPPGLIDKSTRLVLVNAIYFRGKWLVAFPETATRPDDFVIAGMPAFQVPMMNGIFFANYMENNDFQLAEFMYKDNEMSMVVILPKKVNGLPDVEKKLSAKALEQALTWIRRVELNVTLPKFKMTEQFRLRPELTSLGMRDAFRTRIADFTGMENSGRRLNSLFISEVVHKAYVDVDERGTEAAAATAVVMTQNSSANSEPPRPISFRADHPFLFLLRHNGTGSILFMARVFDPRGN
jgi:serpin B